MTHKRMFHCLPDLYIAITGCATQTSAVLTKAKIVTGPHAYYIYLCSSSGSC